MKIRFKTGSMIASPYANDEHKLYGFYVNVKDLPKGIPTDVNPRRVNTNTKVYHSIVNGLLHDKHTFYLDNKGMFITAKNVLIKGHDLYLDLGNGSNHSRHLYGLVDGGHTYYAITHNASLTSNVYVYIRIITGVSNIVRLAKDLNTNVQVQGKAIANLAGRFNPIKKSIAMTKLAGKVSYTQNDNKQSKPYDILRLLSLFYVLSYPSTRQPTIGYNSKVIPFKNYLSNTQFYVNMFKQVDNICRLYDYIEKEAQPAYSLIHSRSRFGAYGGITPLDSIMTHFGYYRTNYKLARALLLPIFSGLRAILDISSQGELTWIVNPYKAIDYALPEIMNYLIKKDKNAVTPKDIGSDTDSYSYCYDHFRLAYANHIINTFNK